MRSLLKAASAVFDHRRQTASPTPSALKRLFFLHLPKCGGTSIDNALQALYREAGAAIVHMDARASKRAAEVAGEPLSDFRSRLLLYHMADDGARYISGHFGFDDRAWRAFGDDWQFVTVLREPVARWYSHYFYNRYKTDNDHFRIDQPLEEFVDSPRARGYGSSYITGLAPECDGAGDEGVHLAIERLERFRLVGLLEKMDVFKRDCAKFLGVPVSTEHRNKSPRSASQREQEISPDVEAKVRALCEPNRRIYDAVVSRIARDGSWVRAGDGGTIAPR